MATMSIKGTNKSSDNPYHFGSSDLSATCFAQDEGKQQKKRALPSVKHNKAEAAAVSIGGGLRIKNVAITGN